MKERFPIGNVIVVADRAMLSAETLGLYTVAFSWGGAVGPILGAVLTYTSATATLGQGLVLLFAYSLGLGLPFILAAVAIDRFLGWFQRYRRFIPIVTRFAGALLVIIGVLLATGYFTLLAGWLSGLTPEVIRSRI